MGRKTIMTDPAATAAWQGNEDLRALLVPIGDLHPHPRNPRRSDDAEIQRSLHRFGQQRPVLALPDGTLVAGHGTWRAAGAEGWTSIAAVRSDLTDQEIEAYLLADNRLGDLGLYDDAQLAELLGEQANLDGIGYSADDLEQLLALLDPANLDQAPRGRTPAELPAATGEAQLFRIMLTYDQPTYEALVARLEAVRVERNLDSYSDVIRTQFLPTD